MDLETLPVCPATYAVGAETLFAILASSRPWQVVTHLILIVRQYQTHQAIDKLTIPTRHSKDDETHSTSESIRSAETAPCCA
jgi:hypothetical protein